MSEEKDNEIDWEIVKDTYSFLIDNYDFIEILQEVSNSKVLPIHIKGFAQDHFNLRYNIDPDSEKGKIYLKALFDFLKKKCEEEESEICKLDYSGISSDKIPTERSPKIEKSIKKATPFHSTFSFFKDKDGTQKEPIQDDLKIYKDDGIHKIYTIKEFNSKEESKWKDYISQHYISYFRPLVFNIEKVRPEEYPSLLLFTSRTCAPCEQVEAILRYINTDEFSNNLRIKKVNILDPNNSSLRSQYDVSSIPTLAVEGVPSRKRLIYQVEDIYEVIFMGFSAEQEKEVSQPDVKTIIDEIARFSCIFFSLESFKDFIRIKIRPLITEITEIISSLSVEDILPVIFHKFETFFDEFESQYIKHPRVELEPYRKIIPEAWLSFLYSWNDIKFHIKELPANLITELLSDLNSKLSNLDDSQLDILPIIRKSELEKFAREHNLRLLSDEDDLRNNPTELSIYERNFTWICPNCSYIFIDSCNNISHREFSCKKCKSSTEFKIIPKREEDIVLPRIKLKSKFVEKFLAVASRPEGIMGYFFAESAGEGRKTVLEWGLSNVNINPDFTILDIGCGAGHNIYNLAKQVISGRVYGIDIAEKMVQIASLRNKDYIEMGRVDIKRASVSSLPFEDNTFDLVMSVESINYWINLDIDLKEIYRVLKENGTVLIINNSYKHEKFAEKHKIWIENIPNITLYTQEQFYEFFEKAGFSNIEIITIEDKNWITITATKLIESRRVFTILKENDLKKFAAKNNLRLLSDYSRFKNIYSILEWICIKCGTLIKGSYHNISLEEYGCMICKEKDRQGSKFDKVEDFHVYTITEEDRHIKIRKETSKKIYKALNMRGLSLAGISKELGFKFKDFPYKDRLISLENYNELKNFILEELGSKGLMDLFGIDDIPHQIFIKSQEQVILDYNPLTSEFISIMLGDGHLNEKGDVVQVTLNRVDEPEYVKYVYNLMKRVFPSFNIQIYGDSYFCEECKVMHTAHDLLYLDHLNHSLIEREVKENKAISLQINTASAHYALTQLGLITGNKVKNKVEVPDGIIRNNKEVKIRSLKGLFDTDGSILVNKSFNKKYQKYYPRLYIKFSNGSRPLVESFAVLCSDLNIHIGNVSGAYKVDKIHYYYEFGISRKQDVKAFIDLVDSQKLREPLRLFYLGCTLIYLSFPINIVEQIHHRITHDYPRNSDRRYSKDFSLYLKNLCEKIFSENMVDEILGFHFKGEVTIDMALKAINDSLSYTQKGIINSRMYGHTFKDFLEFYREHPDASMSLYYKRFPHANKGTLTGYKSRARRLILKEMQN